MTLVIHAPESQAQQGKPSFSKTVSTGLGEGYAIFSNQIKNISIGDKVVILDKETGKRAEGVLDSIVPTQKAGNGWQRYDLGIKDIQNPVTYKSEDLGRNGVAVI